MNNELVTALKSRPWAMEPKALKALTERMSTLNVDGILTTISVARQPKKLNVSDGVAIINISGVLLKSVPGWLRLWGLNATGFDEIREQVSAALANKAVKSIHLVIDSPGGIIDDLEETANLLFEARQAKTLTATIKNLGASAAYWLASQAETIETNAETTEIGSIGVFSVYSDWTKFDEEIGIKVIVIRSGEHKGMGIDGITENQIAVVQKAINEIADKFIDAVARGRGKETDGVAELATGQMWRSLEAKELGLIDTVTVRVNQSSQSDIKGETVMDPLEKTDQVSAEQIEKAETAAVNNERIRMSQLNTEFPDDPEFAIKAYKDGLSVDEAKAEYCDVLREKLAKQSAERGTQHAERSDGAEAIASGDTDDQAGGDFMAEARELAAEKKITVTEAMRKLARQKPALHQAFYEKSRTQGKAMYAEAS